MDASSFMLMQSQSHFPARLKNVSGDILAYGNAQLLRENRSITFQSDFVPLYPMGTPLTIERMNGGDAVHRFSGAVFLSDKTLVRLTEIKGTLLPGAELVYCGGYPYFGRVTLLDSRPVRRLSFLPARRAPVLLSRVAMPEITDTQLVILYDTPQTLTPGQRFLLKPELPIDLPDQTIELVRSGIFAVAQPRLCRFVDMKETDRKKLREFLAAYVQKHNTLF